MNRSIVHLRSFSDDAHFWTYNSHFGNENKETIISSTALREDGSPRTSPRAGTDISS